ncbi:hypothetical protein ABTX15_17895 [Micromonospora sp. NPDC094482]|uniref:hypothetical protein n=1 Tax=unclassified Micromonospora TaxID=2617518 RepID=UPI00331AF40A
MSTPEDAVSWDVLIFDAPAHAGSVDQLPQDFNPPPLGTGPDVRQRLRGNLRDLDLSDPAWGHLVGPTWSIELNIGSEDPVDSIMLHVRGSGDDVLAVVARIVASVGGRALDISSGEFLTGDPPQIAGWHDFQRYQDQILGGSWRPQIRRIILELRPLIGYLRGRRPTDNREHQG